MSNNAASGDFWKTAVHLPPTENNGQPKTEDVADEGTYASGSGSGEPFDPHTLAGIAALSRIVQDGAFDENVEGEDADADYSEFHPGRVTREQIQHFVDGLGTRDPVNEKDAGDDKDAANDGSEAQDEKEEADGREMNGVEEVQGDEKNSDDETRSGEDDGELSDPKYVIKGGRLKRRRNRTTL